MKILKNYEVTNTDGFTVVREQNTTRVVTNGAMGTYALPPKRAIEHFKKELNNAPNTLVELYVTPETYTKIIIKNKNMQYLLLEDTTTSEEYGTSILEYYSQTLYPYDWIAFSTIFNKIFVSKRGIVYLYDGEGFIQIAEKLGPVEVLISDYFTQKVQPITRARPGDTIRYKGYTTETILLNPVEPSYITKTGNKVLLFSRNRECISDGCKNYACAGRIEKAIDTFEYYIGKVDLFQIDIDDYIIIKGDGFLYHSLTKNLTKRPELTELHNTIAQELQKYVEVLHPKMILYHDYYAHLVFDYGIISYDGETALVRNAMIDDIFDALNTIKHAHVVVASDIMDAFLLLTQNAL